MLLVIILRNLSRSTASSIVGGGNLLSPIIGRGDSARIDWSLSGGRTSWHLSCSSSNGYLPGAPTARALHDLLSGVSIAAEFGVPISESPGSVVSAHDARVNAPARDVLTTLGRAPHVLHVVARHRLRVPTETRRTLVMRGGFSDESALVEALAVARISQILKLLAAAD